MPYLEDIQYLKEHIETLHRLLDIMYPITDIKSRVENPHESRRPRWLRIEVENCDDSMQQVELNPDALDTYLVCKQTYELTQARVEQLERSLKDKEQQMFKSML